MQILEKIRAHANAKATQARQFLDELVRTVAYGEEVSPEDAAAVLEQAGVSPDEFAALVDAKLRRVALAERVAGRDAAEKSAAAATSALAAIALRLEEANLAAAVESQRHHQVLDESRRTIADAKSAERQLFESYTGPLR